MSGKNRRVRADFAVDQLPDDLRQKVRAMLVNRVRRADISDYVAQATEGRTKLTESSLSRYWHGVLKNELDEATRRTQTTIAIAKAAREAAQIAGDDPAKAEAVMMRTLEGAFLANEIDPATVDPGKLLRAHAALARVQLQREKLALQGRALEQQIAKFELEIKKLQEEKERRAEEEKGRREAAERAIAQAEQTTGDPQRIALSAIRKALGIQKEAPA